MPAAQPAALPPATGQPSRHTTTAISRHRSRNSPSRWAWQKRSVIATISANRPHSFSGTCRTNSSGRSLFGFCLLIFLVPIDVLGRAPADSLRHPRILPPGHLVLDGLDVDLVPPVVAEVEPVAEAVPDLQAQ